MFTQRVEKHTIKPSNSYYKMLDNFCFLSKNLYNHANYVLRQEFIENNLAIPYAALAKYMRLDTEYPDFQAMPTAQSAQQTLRLLTTNWKSFFKSIKDWSAHPEKYTGRPKLPKYKQKDGRNVLIITNQNAKVRDGILRFPKSFKGFTLKLKCCEKSNYEEFNQVRFIPKQGHIIAEVVYTIYVGESLPDNQRYCSIDIGVDNLAAVTTNCGYHPFLINGKGLKSINQYYNKKLAYYRAIAKRMNNKDYTKRMARITAKRNNKINDIMHKASKGLIDYCQKRKIRTIVIGCNKDWKRNSSLSKKVNQHFVGIPTQRFIEMIQYKAEEARINVILTEESFTYGTSFLDNEMPVKAEYNKSRRVHRGLFISNKGTKINADINASFQILKKAFPSAYSNGIEGLVLNPVRVNIV